MREANRRSLHSDRDDNFARIRLKGLGAGCVDAQLFSGRATSLRDVSETLGLNGDIRSSPSQSGIGYQGSARFALSRSRPRVSLMQNARTIGSVRENKPMLDRVQITRLDESIPRWQIRDIKVSTSQLRYALRASEEQIQEAVNLKPGQQMTIDLYP